MPQRGYGLQPRVAASATLGKESDLVLNRKRGCVGFVPFSLRKRCNRVAVEISFLTSSQGSRSGNPGLEAVAPLGHHRELIVVRTFKAKADRLFDKGVLFSHGSLMNTGSGTLKSRLRSSAISTRGSAIPSAGSAIPSAGSVIPTAASEIPKSVLQSRPVGGINENLHCQITAFLTFEAKPPGLVILKDIIPGREVRK
jgi:hypothetical protein